MKILGIWDGHDSGAAIVIDGSVAVAVNEERLSRRKLEIRFPSQSILTCLSEAGMEASDLHAVAYSTTDVAKTIARVYPESKERYYAIRRRKCLPGRMSNAQKQLKYWLTLWPGNRLTRCIGEAAIRRELRRIGFGDSRLVAIEHHAAHASAAAHCSPFPSCTVVTIDGLGDGLSSTVSRYTDGRMERVAESPAGHSLGIFFEHVTNLLNMRELEDEGKVMALSTFAYPIAAEDNPLMDFFRVRDARLIARYGPFEMYRQLRRVLWQYPAEQFAFMAQQALEHHATSLVRQAVGLTGEARVAYSGGVASNIRANARIRECPEVEELFVFPHMGDGGLAVGAAIAADKEGGANRPAGIEQIYWGPCESAPPEALPAHVRQRSFATLEELLSEAAARLASDEILLWYQSRMEFGPRALGHRSILA
ncbi:MAG: hypothetical protein IT368_15960, partial [Candidatus Hydrogenedentes bacterium]|nr:hypothetical protein [Candidatus Hydrogenedentota bacterium]